MFHQVGKNIIKIFFFEENYYKFEISYKRDFKFFYEIYLIIMLNKHKSGV